jgi:hypothetical protein
VKRTRWDNATRIDLGLNFGIFAGELLQVWPEAVTPYYSLVLRHQDGTLAYTVPVDRLTAARMVRAAARPAPEPHMTYVTRGVSFLVDPRRCAECGGRGTLAQLGGDWGATPDRDVPCWACRPGVAHVGR